MRWIIVILLIYLAPPAAWADAACDEAGLIETTTPAPPYSSYAVRRHLAQMHDAAEVSRVDLVALGDSIVQQWPKSLLQRIADTNDVLNLGVGSDRIQNTLWRLQSGHFDHINAKTVLLLVGTNNLGSDSTCSIKAGYAQLFKVIEQTFHPLRIVLVEVLPRADFEKERIAANKVLRELTGSNGIFKVVSTSNMEAPALQADGLHPTAEGYQTITEQISIQLKR